LPLGSGVRLKSRIDRYFASLSARRCALARAMHLVMHGGCHRVVGARRASASRVARIFVGTSGWVYKTWRAHLYGDVPVRRWLEVASRTFGALEINGSFYSQIKPATYARWAAETPDDFRFALKGHRFVTHYKRLRDCSDSVARLRDQAAHLGDKLAAVVWQLPSRFAADLARLDDFLAALEVWPGARHALELRHRSWFVDAVAARLASARVAVCLSDAPDFPMWREVTTDLVYVRLHGHTRKYASSYSLRSLESWAADARRWCAEGRDVHIYFDNDAEGHAVRNAIALSVLLGGQPPRAPLPVACSERRASAGERGGRARPRSAPPPAHGWSGRRSTGRT
jgi:uncharacterized protein YecE (DUF72 family)